MNIGDIFSIPDTRLPNVIPDLKTMYSKFVLEDVDYPTLAKVWGHKNAKSGTFLAKKSMMATYGLIEGRGKVHITETGRKIAQLPENKKEMNEGLIEAISNVPLWKELFEKYTKNGNDIPVSDFWIDLRQICHISPEEAQNKAEIVRKAYLEDIAEIEPPNGGDSNMNDGDAEQQGNLGGKPPKNQAIRELSFLTDGGLELKLDGVDLKGKWKRYRAVIDAYLGEDTNA